jgi:hypothetical protein
MLSVDHLGILKTWVRISRRRANSKVSVRVARTVLTSYAVILKNSDLLEFQISWFVDREFYEIATFRILPRWRFRISRFRISLASTILDDS